MDAYQQANRQSHQSIILIKKYNEADGDRLNDAFANAALDSVTRNSVKDQRPCITTIRHNSGMTKQVDFALHTEKEAFEKRIVQKLLTFTGVKWSLKV